MHQYFKKKLEINVTEDDIANKIRFSLETNILSQKCTFKGDSLYFTENVDDIVQVVEDIVESVIYWLQPPINTYLTPVPNSLDSDYMENNIVLIKAELLALKSFVAGELYSLPQIMDRIRTEYNQSKILEKNENLRGKKLGKDLIN